MRNITQQTTDKQMRTHMEVPHELYTQMGVPIEVCTQKGVEHARHSQIASRSLCLRCD